MVKAVSKKKEKKKVPDQSLDKQKPTMIVDETKELDHTITDKQLKQVRDDITMTNPGLLLSGLMVKESREEIKNIISKEWQTVVKGNNDNLEYLVREIVGLGVIGDIIKNDQTVTDLNYNGTELIYESNDRKEIYKGNQTIDERYIVQVVQKFARANGEDFTPKNPIFDGKFDDIDGKGSSVRINAVHNTLNANKGNTSLSMRIVRPKLALTEDNYEFFAPMEMLDMLRYIITVNTNVIISGQVGTGKTELQKLLASFIPFDEKIVLIEDVAETFMKEMFKDKDIQSLVTSKDILHDELIRAGLRANPRWLFVSELRGAEAKKAMSGVLSGHFIITTIHAKNAHVIPKRIASMAEEAGAIPSDYEEQLKENLEFGIHIKRKQYKGKVYRYLQEMVIFHPKGNHTIFKQKFTQGIFKSQYYTLPKELLEDKDIELFEDFEEYQKDKFNYMRIDTEFPEGEEIWRKIDDDGSIVPVLVEKPIEKIEEKEKLEEIDNKDGDLVEDKEVSDVEELELTEINT